MGEWRLALVEDLCRRVTSGGTPARSHPEYFADGGPGHSWVKSSELRDGRIRRTEEKITDLGLENSAAKLLDPGAVLVAMYGATAGRVGFLLTEAALNQAICALVSDADRADPAFLFYALRAQYETLSSSTAGAAQQNLNAGTIKALSILVPELRTQRRIAALLSALDDLIELNERRIELLEDLARSLYREWFVGLRFPDHEGKGCDPSERAPLPEGWEECQLREVVTTQYGVTVSASERMDGPRLLRGKDINKSSFISWDQVPCCEITDRDVAKYRLEVGDICVIRMADPGKVGIIERDIEAVFGSYLVRLRSIDPRLPPYLLFHYLESQQYQDWVSGSSTGSTRKSASAAVLTEPKICLPTLEVARKFERIASTLRRQLSLLVEDSAKLAYARDLLLPRLVTGQLDISDLDLGALTPPDPE